MKALTGWGEWVDVDLGWRFEFPPGGTFFTGLLDISPRGTFFTGLLDIPPGGTPFNI